MSKERLPVVSGGEAVEAFKKAGWGLKRRSKKCHFILAKEGIQHHLSVPDHSVLDRGLLRDLIRDSGLSMAEFCALID